MKHVALLIDQHYQELEVWYPYYRLIEAGHAVTLVGSHKNKEYPSKLGYPATSELESSKLSPKKYDAVVIPGGYAPDYMRRDKKMVDFVSKMAKAGKPVAAICHAGWMLASANVIRDKKVTSVSAIKDDMKNAGGSWVDKEVVVDGNIITSRKPDDLPAFMRELLKQLR